MKVITVVIPVYNEALNVKPLYHELSKLRSLISRYEWHFHFVNDGSTDDTWERLGQLAKQDKQVKLLDLSRNYGKEIALSAGVFSADGDATIFIDADLQHPPSCIQDMVTAWENGAEVVEMIRDKSHNESLVRKLGSYFFYKLLDKISDFKIKPRTTDFRLLDRKVVNALCRIKEKQRMFRALIDWMGYRKVELHFEAAQRTHGDPGYSFWKLFRLALNSFISYSTAPLKVLAIFGSAITVSSGLLFMVMITFSFLAPQVFYFTPLAIVAVANTFLMGLVLFALGVVALYINKIFEEVRERPLFVIRETVNLPFVATESDRTALFDFPPIASRGIDTDQHPGM